jgi:hypothetical protein
VPPAIAVWGVYPARRKTSLTAWYSPPNPTSVPAPRGPLTISSAAACPAGNVIDWNYKDAAVANLKGIGANAGYYREKNENRPS